MHLLLHLCNALCLVIKRKWIKYSRYQSLPFRHPHSDIAKRNQEAITPGEEALARCFSSFPATVKQLRVKNVGLALRLSQFLLILQIKKKKKKTTAT